MITVKSNVNELQQVLLKYNVNILNLNTVEKHKSASIPYVK